MLFDLQVGIRAGRQCKISALLKFQLVLVDIHKTPESRQTEIRFGHFRSFIIAPPLLFLQSKYFA